MNGVYGSEQLFLILHDNLRPIWGKNRWSYLDQLQNIEYVYKILSANKNENKRFTMKFEVITQKDQYTSHSSKLPVCQYFCENKACKKRTQLMMCTKEFLRLACFNVKFFWTKVSCGKLQYIYSLSLSIHDTIAHTHIHINILDNTFFTNLSYFVFLFVIFCLCTKNTLLSEINIHWVDPERK